MNWGKAYTNNNKEHQFNRPSHKHIYAKNRYQYHEARFIPVFNSPNISLLLRYLNISQALATSTTVVRIDALH